MKETVAIQPKVSVCVVTYNHEKYIRDCLESLVTQKTNFRFEVIVADDCSRDATKKIVSEYAERYPEIVKPVFHAQNVGAAKNYIFAHEQACGEYIAHMDGDDYALPGKLQSQVDYLDSHPKCNIVWHRMKLLSFSGDVLVDDLIDPQRIPKEGFSRGQLIRFITIGMNSSKMYRSSVRDFNLPDFPVVDYFINVEQIQDGTAAFSSNLPLGVYRVGIGVASSGNLTKRILRDSFDFFLKKYPHHRRDISFAASTLFLAALKNRHWENVKVFLPIVFRSLSIFVIADIYSQRHMVSMFKLPSQVRKVK
ncbi:glycosyltransferase [uncultured Massilia sp.]|uniref:glycosyltransferase family 2 protein n=1 Tax=uncultured Massilia sp. TaxID=169973 RepID=UPI0025E705BF|nr:glycosyltransferase [uncultured Massilia sp.]